MDEFSQGTVQTAYVADAARQNTLTQSFFYTLGDIFGGTDTATRIPTISGNSVDVAVDANGMPYKRGTTQSLFSPGTLQPMAQPADTGPSAATLLLGGLALWLFLRRGK